MMREKNFKAINANRTPMIIAYNKLSQYILTK